MSIKAFVFDAYGTLFDVYSVKEKCVALYGDKGAELSVLWRDKQVEYSFLRQLMGQYKPFSQITQAALKYAIHQLHLEYDASKMVDLMKSYEHLELYPEVVSALKELKGTGTVAIFSNGSRDMLDPLIESSGLSPYVEQVISVDEVKQYKPTPASYTQVLNRLAVNREEVLFFSCNGWDISGAKSFGFRTAWINRHHLPVEELNQQPDSVHDDLKGILEWIN
ncbi:haloacid dehalogenase type II [Sporolactobacillus sp. CPB3-1]|uniref:Haloacid dehalogenase type II n=1 Tax=Sporolactobacillus mangiferae TaxID=2940498 RepID=A0ABT0MF15_9BACL|nr:haloacid dehalogenase type II [Sporolactobacillus mangiferae]MCL1632854.1 haloacid dehalogenase type II [Sporolactobacillus mangiferae]